MREPHFLIMPLGTGYLAASNSNGQYRSEALAGFGDLIRQEMRRRLGSNVRVEFSLAESLRSQFSPCETCHGTGDVKNDGVAAQFFANDFGTMDFSEKAMTTCAACAGLGVRIPDFWSTLFATA
jgi:hypothetical protein